MATLLTKSNYRDYIPLDIAALSFAESGAQGYAGRIEIVTFDQDLYYFNYCNDEWEENDIYSICPELQECSFGPFSRKQVPNRWEYYYLGGGNHLIVSKRISYEFDKNKGENIQNVDLYLTWLDNILEVLKKDPNSHHSYNP